MRGLRLSQIIGRFFFISLKMITFNRRIWLKCPVRVLFFLSVDLLVAFNNNKKLMNEHWMLMESCRTASGCGSQRPEEPKRENKFGEDSQRLGWIWGWSDGDGVQSPKASTNQQHIQVPARPSFLAFPPWIHLPHSSSQFHSCLKPPIRMTDWLNWQSCCAQVAQRAVALNQNAMIWENDT